MKNKLRILSLATFMFTLFTINSYASENPKEENFNWQDNTGMVGGINKGTQKWSTETIEKIEKKVETSLKAAEKESEEWRKTITKETKEGRETIKSLQEDFKETKKEIKDGLKEAKKIVDEVPEKLKTAISTGIRKGIEPPICIIGGIVCFTMAGITFAFGESFVDHKSIASYILWGGSAALGIIYLAIK